MLHYQVLSAAANIPMAFQHCAKAEIQFEDICNQMNRDLGLEPLKPHKDGDSAEL